MLTSVDCGEVLLHPVSADLLTKPTTGCLQEYLKSHLQSQVQASISTQDFWVTFTTYNVWIDCTVKKNGLSNKWNWRQTCYLFLYAILIHSLNILLVVIASYRVPAIAVTAMQRQWSCDWRCSSRKAGETSRSKESVKAACWDAVHTYLKSYKYTI